MVFDVRPSPGYRSAMRAWRVIPSQMGVIGVGRRRRMTMATVAIPTRINPIKMVATTGPVLLERPCRFELACFGAATVGFVVAPVVVTSVVVVASTPPTIDDSVVDGEPPGGGRAPGLFPATVDVGDAVASSGGENAGCVAKLTAV